MTQGKSLSAQGTSESQERTKDPHNMSQSVNAHEGSQNSRRLKAAAFVCLGVWPFVSPCTQTHSDNAV